MMFNKNKETAKEHPMRTQARRRMEMLPAHEILNWADMAGSGLAKALDDYRRLRDVDSLRDAESAVAALAGTVDALLAREH